jgi:hypothetical protein
MTENLSEIASAAERFVQMHELLLRNEGSTFGGAVVIVPPKNAGDQVELLMLDAQGDPAQFWSTIQTRIAIILDKLKDQERVGSAFGRR